MQFIFRGEFSKGLDTQTAMGVTFRGREPSEVTEAPAIDWLDGHPDYERVPEVQDEAPRVPNLRPWPGTTPKKPASKPRKAKAKK